MAKASQKSGSRHQQPLMPLAQVRSQPEEQHRPPGIRATFYFGQEDLAQRANSTHQLNIYNRGPWFMDHRLVP